ncbi:MAG TPA: AAA family ATPase [Baekduia sp.]|jgi:DNA-binding CsgD family transcriptional regulator
MGLSETDQAPLLERDAELDAVGAAIAAAREGRGRAVVVEGAAGTGKSALLEAARARAATDGLRVLRAAAGEHERGYAFGCVRQLFEPLLRTAGPDARAALLSGAAAPAEQIVAPTTADAQAADGFAALNAVYWLTANVAAGGPLLLIADDVHWADDASVRAIAHLARRIGELPVVLLVALRPQEPGAALALLDDLTAAPLAARIATRPLSPAAVAAIVRTRAPEATDAACAACHAASAGNPLYVQELLRTFAGDTGGLRAERIAAASVPTLAARVGRRIAKVALGAPALAVAMAVLGDGESLTSAAALAGLAPTAAADVARRLRELEVLTTEDPFAFVHPLVRHSVYDGLSVAERDTAHAAAARLLDAAGAPAEAVAAHLTALRPAGSSAVAAGLVAAAEAAVARAAPEAASRLLHRALEEGAPEPSRAALLLALGRAELLLRDPVCVAHLSEARALAAESEPALRMAATVALAEVLSFSGEWAAARAMVWEGLREAGDADAELICDLEAVRTAIMANDPLVADEFPAARARLDALSTGPSWSAHALAALLASQAALRGEGPERAGALAQRALGDGVLLAGHGGGSWAAPQVLMAYAYTERYDDTLELAATVEREGRRSGSLIAVFSGLAFRGVVATQRGDLRAAEADLRTIADFVLQTGMAMWSTTMFFAFADVLLERPDLDDIAAAAEAFAVPEAFLATNAGAQLLSARGRLRIARGEREAGLADLRGVAAVAGPLEIGPSYDAWRSALALALPAADRDEALRLADEELALARAVDLPRTLGVALRGRALLEDTAGSVALLEESVAVLDGSEAVLEHARSRAALGAALRRARRRAEARPHLTVALDLADRCGADRLVERVRDDLLAAGGRPRRTARVGVDALTASELRVARLAAAGRTNVAIAQELYVSVKTVETHLSHAYAKLDLAGQGARGRLAAMLSGGG